MPSELAHITAQIEHEYTAAQLGLSGLASGTSRHRIITARQERLGVLHEQLQQIVGEQAIMIVSDTLDRLPASPTRQQVQQVVRREWGETQETRHLLARLDALWRQLDQLGEHVGREAACKLVNAPSLSTQERQPS